MTDRGARPDVTAPPLIRHATGADLDGIVEVYLASARHHARLDPAAYRVPDPDAVRARFARELAADEDEDLHLVAIVDGRVVGHADAGRAPGPRPSMRIPTRTAHVGIAVLDEWQGLGLGTALLEAIEDWGRESGLDALVLYVAAGNDGARRLYERLGYRSVSEHMAKPLSSSGSGPAGARPDAERS